MSVTIVEPHTSSETTASSLKMSSVSWAQNFILQSHPTVKAQKLVDDCTLRATNYQFYIWIIILIYNPTISELSAPLALYNQITGVSKLFPEWWSRVTVIVSIHGAGWITTYRIWLVVAASYDAVAGSDIQSSSREQAKKVGEPSPWAVSATFLPIFRPQWIRVRARVVVVVVVVAWGPEWWGIVRRFPWPEWRILRSVGRRLVGRGSEWCVCGGVAWHRFVERLIWVSGGIRCRGGFVLTALDVGRGRVRGHILGLDVGVGSFVPGPRIHATNVSWRWKLLLGTHSSLEDSFGRRFDPGIDIKHLWISRERLQDWGLRGEALSKMCYDVTVPKERYRKRENCDAPSTTHS